MEARSSPTCPICEKPVPPLGENAVFPFCSPQCKLVDLGRWLDGSYRVPGPPAESSVAGGVDPQLDLDEED